MPHEKKHPAHDLRRHASTALVWWQRRSRGRSQKRANLWVAGGKAIYDGKCMPCHKLDNTKLVGPGWKDVTKRRTPVWIMNMICNTDYMLSTDADAQKQLELCLVRMPNMNVTVEDARKIVEFMRGNDGEK